ncbi:MAG: hypothetical protein ACE5JX_06040 [Acidobacteriota bacterium]
MSWDLVLALRFVPALRAFEAKSVETERGLAVVSPGPWEERSRATFRRHERSATGRRVAWSSVSGSLSGSLSVIDIVPIAPRHCYRLR